jgi:hypothetical protein
MVTVSGEFRTTVAPHDDVVDSVVLGESDDPLPRFADLEGGLQRCVVRIRCVLGLFEERLGLLSRCASVRLSAALP